MAEPNIEFLRKVRLFSELDDKALGQISNAAVEQRWEPGQEIVRQGDSGVGAFIIRSGKVEIVQEHAGATEKMRDLGPGQFFGEMALLDEFPRSATARALEPTTCLQITRWHFRGILESHPEIALKLLPMLTKRIRAAESHAHEVAATH
ncbi:MAG: cyclic nucleotide-binding domain-containing protein [Candidatus Limnocylindria bacterium]